MSDVTEAIIKRIRSMPNPPCHVGEVIPQEVVEYPYVFIMKNSEEYADDLCYPRHKESIMYDIEVVSDDIDETRQYSSDVKNWLMNTEMHSLIFLNDDGLEQTIHGLLVEDHDDSYTVKYPDSDERLFIGAIDVEAVLGQLT
jgi:hypothetical protein